MNPIDDDCPDYYTIIPKVDCMDLGTVEKMIRQGNVGGGDDLLRLITKVVTNALTYNNANDHVVHQEALVLRRFLGEVSVDLGGGVGGGHRHVHRHRHGTFFTIRA